jgi:hypothetical protein
MTSRHARVTLLAAAALTLAACSSTGGGATSGPTPPLGAAQPPVVNVQPSALIATPTPEPTASQSASPSDTSAAETQAPATSIDPCTLLTTDEASTLIGVKVGAGVSTMVDQDRECTFKKGTTTEVKLILAPPASDVATATSYWDAERAQVPADFPPVKDISLFDRAAYGSGSAVGLSISALFVLHGTQAFDVYCGFPACGEDASVTAALLIGGRLP